MSRNWEKIQSESYDNLEFAQKWVKELHFALLTHRHDRIFKEDVLESAVAYWDNNMTEQQKSDVFVFMLGFLSRK